MQAVKPTGRARKRTGGPRGAQLTDHDFETRDQHVFILWPALGDPDWRDTGEGGLFSYLVYRALIYDRIEVDVTAHLHAPTMPIQGALKTQLWAAPSIGGPVDQQRSLKPWSAPLRAAIFLGSCPRSLVHSETGEPFQVSVDSLTRTGDAIKHCLDYEYGFGGDILTFSGRPAPRRWRWPRPLEATGTDDSPKYPMSD